MYMHMHRRVAGVMAALSYGESNCHLDRVLVLACLCYEFLNQLYYEFLYQLRKHRQDRTAFADVFQVLFYMMIG